MLADDRSTQISTVLLDTARTRYSIQELLSSLSPNDDKGFDMDLQLNASCALWSEQVRCVNRVVHVLLLDVRKIVSAEYRPLNFPGRWETTEINSFSVRYYAYGTLYG